MKTNGFFYTKGVDIHNPKSMFMFLFNHFKYYTLNSWNGLKSIANKVKLYDLQLGELRSKAGELLFDETDKSGLCTVLIDMIDDWEADHPNFRVYFNGRSDGYLVLANKDNFKSIFSEELDDYMFGFDGNAEMAYEEFKAFLHDYGWRVEDMYQELRSTVLIVREFDELCDEMRNALISITENYEEER